VESLLIGGITFVVFLLTLLAVVQFDPDR